MRKIVVICLVCIGVSLGMYAGADAGWFDDILDDAVQDLGRRAVNDATESAYEETKTSAGKARDAILHPDEEQAGEESVAAEEQRASEVPPSQ